MNCPVPSAAHASLIINADNCLFVSSPEAMLEVQISPRLLVLK